MLKKLKEHSGDFVLEGAWKLLLACALIALFISVLGLAFQSNKLAAIADDMARSIEISGQVDSSADAKLEELKVSSGLDVTMDIDANYSAGGNRIQFGDSFIVTISYTGKLGIGGILSFPVHLSSSVVGRSERYWK